MSGKLAVIGTILSLLFGSVAVLTIGMKESNNESIIWGIGLLIGALTLWLIMAIKMRNESKRNLIICLLMLLIPWDF